MCPTLIPEGGKELVTPISPGEFFFFLMSSFSIQWTVGECFCTQEVDHNGVSEQQRKSHQHPGQERRLEGQEAEEVHAYEWMSSTPHVHQHDDEGLTQEEDVGEQTEQLQLFRLSTTHH